MIEHLSEKQADDFYGGLLSPDELVQLDHHLATCSACHDRFSQSARLRQAVAALRADLASAGDEPSHLAYEQLAAYADGQLDSVESETLESHLADCPTCTTELQELQAFRQQLRHSAIDSSQEADDTKLSGNVLPFWRTGGFRRVVQMAAAAAAIALLIWAATIPLRRELDTLHTQLAEAQKQNDQLRSEYESAQAEVEELQSQLAAGQPPEDAAAIPDDFVVALNDGNGRIILDRAGNLAGLENLPPAVQQLAKAALTSERIENPQEIKDLSGQAIILMGRASNGVAFGLMSPVGTVVTADRPMLRWQALVGASGYRVSVFDADFNEVASSPLLTATSWTINKSLARGRIYSWQVTASKDGAEIKSPAPPAPIAQFKVLEKSRADEIAAAKRNHANAHLPLGLLYARAGLLDDAERELQALLRNNPNSAVARKLLTQVRALRRK